MEAAMMRRVAALAIGLGVAGFASWRLLNGEADAGDRLFCAVLAGALALLVIVASGRIGFGLLAAGSIAGLVWMIGSLKLAYLHEPLLAPDLRYFANAATLDVVRHYPGLERKLAEAIAGVFLAILAWRLESPGLWRSPLARIACTFAAVLLLGWLAWPHGPFRSVYAIGTWDFIPDGLRNPTTAFVRSLSRMRVAMPGFDPADARRYDWETPSAVVKDPAQRPDIVVVLEESTLDPRGWAACDVPRCTFDLFEPTPQTRAQGLLEVHTWGGATWTSEFAFLTGLPHTLFGPAGIYAPYTLAPRMRETLPKRLKALGYRTVALYPMPRDFVRAGDAYSDYGFDEFHDADELGLTWDSTDAELVERFEQLHRKLRTQDDQPLFVMLLTMRQHGPHDHPLDGLPPPWNQPLPRIDARLAHNLGTYLYRMHGSSDAMAELRRYLFTASRPAVLAHFGDHHPSFDGLERTLASSLPPDLRPRARELTYFRIESAGGDAPPTPFPTLDIAFLGALVLDTAGLPRGPYFEANALLRERCNGRFEECADHRVLASFLARTLGELRAFAP